MKIRLPRFLFISFSILFLSSCGTTFELNFLEFSNPLSSDAKKLQIETQKILLLIDNVIKSLDVTEMQNTIKEYKEAVAKIILDAENIHGFNQEEIQLYKKE